MERRQEELLRVFDEVRAELLQNPTVEDVGVGVKERAGELTDEVVFRGYVREKKPEEEVAPEHVVPTTIRGFSTDVLVVRHPELIIGFGDEDDAKNYKTK